MQSASYHDHWLRVLEADKRAIFTVASAAQKTADYLLAGAGVDACAASVEDAA